MTATYIVNMGGLWIPAAGNCANAERYFTLMRASSNLYAIRPVVWSIGSFVAFMGRISLYERLTAYGLQTMIRIRQTFIIVRETKSSSHDLTAPKKKLKEP